MFPVFFALTIFLLSVVIAQDYKLEISTAKASFEAGENITLKIAVFDSNNNPINDKVLVILEDAEKIIKIEQMVPSNKFVDIFLERKSKLWTRNNNCKIQRRRGSKFLQY